MYRALWDRTKESQGLASVHEARSAEFAGGIRVSHECLWSNYARYIMLKM